MGILPLESVFCLCCEAENQINQETVLPLWFSVPFCGGSMPLLEGASLSRDRGLSNCCWCSAGMQAVTAASCSARCSLGTSMVWGVISVPREGDPQLPEFSWVGKVQLSEECEASPCCPPGLVLPQCHPDVPGPAGQPGQTVKSCLLPKKCGWVNFACACLRAVWVRTGQPAPGRAAPVGWDTMPQN